MILARKAHIFLVIVVILALGLSACIAATPTEAPARNEPTEEVSEPTETVAPPEQPEEPTETPTPTATAMAAPTETPTPTTAPTSTEDPLAFLETLIGPIDARTDIIWDIAKHFGFILLPETFTLNVQRDSAAPDASLIFDGEGNWVKVTGNFFPILPAVNFTDTTALGLFEATGQGTVAGRPNITVSLIGNLSPKGIDAFARYGAGGELPQGRSALYHVFGSWNIVISSTVDVEPQTIDDFLPDLIASLRQGDQQALLQKADPFALAFYGIPQCQAFLAARETDPAEDIVPTGDVSIGTVPFTWDGLNVEFDNVVQVPVNYTRLGQTSPATLLFRQVGVHLAWEPDCGEPLK